MDDATLAFYATEAQAYAARNRKVERQRLTSFAALLPPGGRILELGCGGGHDTEALLALGLDVTPTDGSAELALEAARRIGRPVGVLLFDDIDATDEFDGIWANACLLHVPRAALPSVLAKIHQALKPGGIFHASFKAGSEEGRDRLGRFYNYPSVDWLRAVYGREGWERIYIEEVLGDGYDGEPTNWLYAFAIKKR